MDELVFVSWQVTDLHDDEPWGEADSLGQAVGQQRRAQEVDWCPNKSGN